MTDLKAAALRLLTSNALSPVFYPLARGRAAVFMCHRFAHPSRRAVGHDAKKLAECLEYLRRQGFKLISLMQLLDKMERGPRPLSKSVVFTVDDGYADFHNVAAPIFARFDCPVTLFITTGFLDGEIWLWWDQIEYILRRGRRVTLRAELEGEPFTLDCSDDHRQESTAEMLVRRLKTVDEEQKHSFLAWLSYRLDVPLPDRPPHEYAPLSWDQVRELARLGISFGPHTVTHPILSRVNDSRSAWEIRESWNRLRDESPSAIPVFCYPNGMPADYSERELAFLKESELIAAMAAHPGYAVPFTGGEDHTRYRLPRFSYPDNRPRLVQIVSGLQRLSDLVRPG